MLPYYVICCPGVGSAWRCRREARGVARRRRESLSALGIEDMLRYRYVKGHWGNGRALTIGGAE